MTKQPSKEVDGTILEALPNGMFRVEREDNQMVLAQVPDRMLKHFRIGPGDRVRVLLSPDDLNRGRITYLYK